MSLLAEISDLQPATRIALMRNSVQKELDAPVISPKWELITDASDIKLQRDIDKKGNTILHMNVGDNYHLFDHKSRVARRLENTPIFEVEASLKKSQFFKLASTSNIELYDFAPSDYFVHSEQSIQALMDILGVTMIPNGRSKQLHKNSQLKEHYFGRTYSAADLSIESLNQNGMFGDFSSIIRFVWSPFTHTISTSYELMRLICANGAVGLANFLNTKIPLVDMWQQNLDIACKHIQTQVDDKFTTRLQQMHRTHASVGVLLNLQKHVEERLGNADNSFQETMLLEGVQRVINPVEHCGHIYKDNVFNDVNVASQVQSHLSKLDVFNIVTELSSHTIGTEKSSMNALQRMANQLLWTEKDFKTSRFIESPFANTQHAFYGLLQEVA